MQIMKNSLLFYRAQVQVELVHRFFVHLTVLKLEYNAFVSNENGRYELKVVEQV